MSSLPGYSRDRYHFVIDLPSDYEIYDFSKGYDADRVRNSPYGIGKYDELRPGMYATALFSPASEQARNIHVGIDIGAPAGTPVFAFFDGRIHSAAINSAPGDYGGTLITEHLIDGVKLWVLHGHLSHGSLNIRAAGAEFKKGETLAYLGNKSENGGWNPHLHFQLSLKEPKACDMPGAVSAVDRERALREYPDPRIVLGPLY
ncbi:MAG TPA: peptidoglycan DD-metalloendopeptidase family protein [Bdellovibrionales bacterium]|jgi:murein DD-endopeptidase MepM/ murein hydrolase activator NlpD|nr:peptidoglycan DD-metalloendopeptidase family protein [Bdellovibrionales bacterium]